MKLSTAVSTLFGAALFFASNAVADVDYFHGIQSNAVFLAGSSIQFIVDEMPNGDDHDRVFANLHREDGSFVENIRNWDHDECDDDEFSFSWFVGRNLPSGRYFVEITSDDDDDDISRSFIFEIDCDCDTASNGSNGNSHGSNGNSHGSNGNSRGSNGNSRGSRGNSRGSRGNSRGGRGSHN